MEDLTFQDIFFAVAAVRCLSFFIFDFAGRGGPVMKVFVNTRLIAIASGFPGLSSRRSSIGKPYPVDRVRRSRPPVLASSGKPTTWKSLGGP